MSKSKFKVGDRVKVVKITGSTDKTKHMGKKFTVSFTCGADGYKYSLKDSNGLSNGWYYSDEELELVTSYEELGTYTGIELLQAIQDGVFKDGDGLEVLYNGKHMDRAKVTKCGSGSTIRYEGGDIHGNVVGTQVIINKHVTFKPIKKEPINIAKENKMLDVKIPVEILGGKELINAKVTINGNKIVVKLPSGIKGVASCCPEDKFDERKGIRLASVRAIKKQIIYDLDKNI